MIPPVAVSRWQEEWSRILDLAYYKKGLPVYGIRIDLPLDKRWKNEPNYEEITFEYMWKKYSQLKDENGIYLQPQYVPELKNLYIPYSLFNCLGSSTFLGTCFPNCTITWSDS